MDSRTGPVVSALVAEGLLDTARTEDAANVVDRVLTGGVSATATLRHRLAELAGYVGGAFVVSAAALFAADQWDGLSTAARVGLLGGVAALLAAAGVLLGLADGGFSSLRDWGQPVRRRLAGVLFTGAAAAAAGAVGVQVDASMGSANSASLLAAALTMAVLAALGYVVAPTVLGQVAIAGALMTAVPATLDVVGEVTAVAFGLIMIGLGAAWLLLAERSVWYEVGSARVVGCLLAVIGAQIPVESQHAWVGYVATVLVAGAGFAMYVGRRAWPYLAVGVAGLTLAVPEALFDWTKGSMGSAGVLLVAGVALLGAALLGLRLRQAH